jgi:transposase
LEPDEQFPKGKVTFKSYDQNQLIFLPPSLEDLISDKHLVRVVNEVVDRIDLRILERRYVGGGASNYHPKMMLKVLIYAYSTKIYTSRKIAQALQESVHFMWLSAMQAPDFRTINNFRSGQLRPLIDEVFNQVLQFLLDNQYVRLEHYFVDGTKLAADANKYSHVWAKNTERYKKGTQQKISDLLRQIEAENDREQEEYGDDNLEEFGENSPLSSEEIYKKAQQINERLKEQQDGPLDKKKVRKLVSEQKRLKQYAGKLAKYEQQEKRLAGRRSYSKTDPDATFMRLRDGQLLPCYNIIQGTENQYVVNYTIEQSAGESQAFPSHMEKLRTRTSGKMPGKVVSDAGFGSAENYAYLEERNIDNYVKYTGIYYEQSKKYKGNRFHKDNFDYDKQTDSFTCPNNQQLVFEQETLRRNVNGYATKIRVYKSRGCEGCRFGKQCKKGENDRSIRLNPTYEAYKQQVRTNFDTTVGIAMRKRRGWDVETPFGDIKHNQNYRRFRLRGREKVNVEWGLLCISHNLRKVAIQV